MTTSEMAWRLARRILFRLNRHTDWCLPRTLLDAVRLARWARGQVIR